MYLQHLDSIIILSAFALDMMIGDPAWPLHPVRLIGLMIQKLELVLRKAWMSKTGGRFAGFLLVIIVVPLVYFATYMVISLSNRISPVLGIVISVIVSYTAIAARSLSDAARAVLVRLEGGDLSAAREELSMIVGRDTESLDEQGIIRAVVETVAENTSDGVVAPLFYLAIGGPALAMAYKAVNTLDSMVGYKNEKYIHFGWTAARLDDIANYIPARLTAFLISLASDMLRLSGRWALRLHDYDISIDRLYSAWQVMLRDGRNHTSPNSGYPEAAVAGALGVRLGGPSLYGGRLVPKPYIGDVKNGLKRPHVMSAVKLMYCASFSMAVFSAGIRLVLNFLLTKTVTVL